jgi:hypothetical protein
MFRLESGAGFNRWGFVLARTKTHRLKPAPCQFGPVVNASVNKVFCSSSCALAEPVAGLALADRFTERTGMSGK